MPNLLWKAYIDFEVDEQGDCEIRCTQQAPCYTICIGIPLLSLSAERSPLRQWPHLHSPLHLLHHITSVTYVQNGN